MWGVAVIAVGVLIYSIMPLKSDQVLIERAQTVLGVVDRDLPLPDSVQGKRIKLGEKLFFDFRLSRDGSTACVRCHSFESYGADGLPQSIGVQQLKTARNAQSVLNLKYQHFFHWRIDRESLEDQAEKAFTNPEGLGHTSEKAAVQALKRAGYEAQFNKAFPNDPSKVSLKNAAIALAEYQRTLVTPAPFDRFLSGDMSALTKEQKKGFRNFMKLGCVSCHNGPAIGGRDFQRFGTSTDYWTVTGSKVHDLGRMAVSGNSGDRNVFKVPSLRNVAKTAPYFHDGSAKDLTTAVRWMALLQLGRELSAAELGSLVSFLESLTGEKVPGPVSGGGE